MYGKLLQIGCVLLTAIVATGYARTETEPSTPQEFTKSNADTDPIYIPSPFAEGSNLTAVPGMQVSAEFPSLPIPSNPAVVRAGADYKGRKQIQIQTILLRMDRRTADEIFQSINLQNIGMSGGQLNSEWSPSPDAADKSENLVQCHDSILRGHPTTWGRITAEDFDRIVGLTKATTMCNITQTPTTTTYEGQTATVFDGSLQTFVVRVEPRLDDNNRWKNVPVSQAIEDGIIAKHRGSVTEKGIRLESTFIANSIVSVDSFTFSGSDSEKNTIQVPHCHCTKLKCSLEIEKGNLILIDPNIIREGSQSLAQNFVGRLMKQADYERVETKTMFILKAAVVE